jgi:transcriptional regulator PpsR
MPTSPRSSGKPFEAPARTLGGLDAETAAAVIRAGSDVALILDRDGIIRDMAFGSDDLLGEGGGNWRGQPWTGTVTAESRATVESMLQDAAAKAPPRWRHVDHLSPHGTTVSVEYAAVQLGSGGRVVALGRDLRPVAALQQRLALAQQAMERDYARLRHAEARYRLLFQMVAEAVLIVDAETLRILEANPASPVLLGDTERVFVGRPFLNTFAAESKPAIEAMLATARTGGRSEDVNVRMAGSERRLVMAAQLVRHESTSQFLVRLARRAQDSGPANPTALMLTAVVAGAPDAFVVTDPEGRIVAANPAFIDLTQLATEERARGESLERWLGRPGVDLNVMLTNLRQYGIVRLFATTLRGEHGSDAEVEISAVAVPQGKPPCLGFTIRDVGRRLGAGTRAGGELPRSVEQVTERVGRVPLRKLVREATDLIERLCIESALELTHDNRVAAAELLGLSRQSLYVKLRKYGLGNLADGAD